MPSTHGATTVPFALPSKQGSLAAIAAIILIAAIVAVCLHWGVRTGIFTMSLTPNPFQSTPSQFSHGAGKGGPLV